MNADTPVVIPEYVPDLTSVGGGIVAMTEDKNVGLISDFMRLIEVDEKFVLEVGVVEWGGRAQPYSRLEAVS